MVFQLGVCPLILGHLGQVSFDRWRGVSLLKIKKAEPGVYSRFRSMGSELLQLSLDLRIVDRTVNDKIFDAT